MQPLFSCTQPGPDAGFCVDFVQPEQGGAFLVAKRARAAWGTGSVIGLYWRGLVVCGKICISDRGRVDVLHFTCVDKAGQHAFLVSRIVCAFMSILPRLVPYRLCQYLCCGQIIRRKPQ
ncbi:hypothetical protein VFPPC_15772 [Pochonia chlamydosporia 170]|uniref:Uncharacterized protein n=1 Tax=Pochonia chlamydosporia 170 TaxID=1380566 RepID=A0A179FS74_METCM|nr:hypothetical protein VFPPC_15772 [Pochonia chlamydosporia 170]OAQ68050.1 hypothetical protein VFPPC_15772 [Pochonia chlamydosporia 170]